jgi:hypothetical protein
MIFLRAMKQMETTAWSTVTIHEARARSALTASRKGPRIHRKIEVAPPTTSQKPQNASCSPASRRYGGYLGIVLEIYALHKKVETHVDRSNFLIGSQSIVTGGFPREGAKKRGTGQVSQWR